MRPLKKLTTILLITLSMAFGCKNGADNQHSRNSLYSIKKHTAERPSLEENVISQDTISPFKEVDSLVKLLNKSFVLSDVEELNRICLTSDGELSELFDIIAVDLLNSHLVKFLEYLQRNPGSCLEKKIIVGLSAKYCVYEKPERPQMLRDEQNKLISMARAEKMEAGKIKLINELFNKVDPNLFD